MGAPAPAPAPGTALPALIHAPRSSMPALIHARSLRRILYTLVRANTPSPRALLFNIPATQRTLKRPAPPSSHAVHPPLRPRRLEGAVPRRRRRQNTKTNKNDSPKQHKQDYERAERGEERKEGGGSDGGGQEGRGRGAGEEYGGQKAERKVEYGSVGEEEGTRGRGEETAGRKVGSGKVEWKQYKEKDTREKRETRLEAEREVAKCKGHGTHPKWRHAHVAQERAQDVRARSACVSAKRKKIGSSHEERAEDVRLEGVQGARAQRGRERFFEERGEGAVAGGSGKANHLPVRYAFLSNTTGSTPPAHIPADAPSTRHRVFSSTILPTGTFSPEQSKHRPCERDRIAPRQYASREAAVQDALGEGRVERGGRRDGRRGAAAEGRCDRADWRRHGRRGVQARHRRRMDDALRKRWLMRGCARVLPGVKLESSIFTCKAHLPRQDRGEDLMGLPF
ncbi:hypothetical protein B0H14DRAFT_2573177 [Mycena olivaceomarginata]|nr:hypothetical protein B0H14DRAFT_2573177 [Mycena olivaceomarginata]